MPPLGAVTRGGYASDMDRHRIPSSPSPAARARGARVGGEAGSERRLLIAAALTMVTLVAEAVGGWLSGSLALLADAGHMLVDASALLLAWLGAWLARRPADARRSFGYARTEVLAGFVNALTMILLVLWIGWEAVQRIRDPAPILSGLMLVVAVAGLVVNLVVLKVLGGHAHGHDHVHAHHHGDGNRHGHAHGESYAHASHRAQGEGHAHAVGHAAGERDLNVQGARLHVIGDLLGSVAAIIAALVVRYTGWTVADRILSLLVAVLILASAWRLMRRSANILLEGVPDGIDLAQVSAFLAGSHPAVRDVHHLHVWSLGQGRRMATFHVRTAPHAQWREVTERMRTNLRERFGIDHATIQVEPDGPDDCVDEDCAPAVEAPVRH
jgi:cobalt-zinc-cadmium efflux system protein